MDGGPKKLFEWTVLLHNIVNVENNKPPMDLDEAYALYTGGSGLDQGMTPSSPCRQPFFHNTNDAIVTCIAALVLLSLFGLGIFFIRRR